MQQESTSHEADELTTDENSSYPRLVTRVVDCEPEALRMDMPVHVVFRTLSFADVEGEVTAPMFAPSEPARGTGGR